MKAAVLNTDLRLSGYFETVFGVVYSRRSYTIRTGIVFYGMFFRTKFQGIEVLHC